MKRIITVLAALIIISCGIIPAQKKGEISIGGTIGVSGGYSKTSPVVKISGKGSGSSAGDQDLTMGGHTTIDVDSKAKEKTPSSTVFNAGVEFGWFFADNWKLGATLQYALDSNPYEKNNDKWLRQNTGMILAGPQLSYYLRICDGFFFTPQIAVFGTAGTVKIEADSYTNRLSAVGYGFELDPGAFEFRPSHRFAFTVSFLSFAYSHVKISRTYYDIKTDNVTYDLAIQPSIGLRYYF